MNGHVGVTGSPYRPVEEGESRGKPEPVSVGLMRSLVVIYVVEISIIVAAVHYWSWIGALLDRVASAVRP